MVNCAVPNLAGKAVLVTLTVIPLSTGTVAGGVYSPDCVTVPYVELPPVIPLMAHVTVLGESGT